MNRGLQADTFPPLGLGSAPLPPHPLLPHHSAVAGAAGLFSGNAGSGYPHCSCCTDTGIGDKHAGALFVADAGAASNAGAGDDTRHPRCCDYQGGLSYDSPSCTLLHNGLQTFQSVQSVQSVQWSMYPQHFESNSFENAGNSYESRRRTRQKSRVLWLEQVRHENACKPCHDPFQGIPLGDAARLHPTPCDTSFEFNGGVDSADVSTVAPNSVCSSLNTVSEDSASVISCDGNTLRIASANEQILLPYQESRAYAKNSMDLLRSKIQD